MQNINWLMAFLILAWFVVPSTDIALRAPPAPPLGIGTGDVVRGGSMGVTNPPPPPPPPRVSA